MVNLLPVAAKKKILIEYYVRVASVWMMLLSFSLLAVSALFLPTMILIKSQLVAMNLSFKEADAATQSFTSSEEVVLRANQAAKELSRLNEYPSLWQFVPKLESLSGSDIDISTIATERVPGSAPKITISGEASTRAALAAFRDRVEADEVFDSVVLPLSSLAKDREVPFTITITASSI